MEELPHEHIEHAEHAGHAAHSGDNFMVKVSATIAVLAVVAAVIASFETIETGAAISEKNAAVLKQNQASDQWAYYQAKSIRQHMYSIAAASGTGRTEDYEKQARRYAEEIKVLQKKAEELEHQRDEKLEASEKHEEKHHGLTLAATLVHISIAVATIAIITKGQRWPWYAAIALGAAGTAKAVATFLV
jgi:cell division protein FtsN